MKFLLQLFFIVSIGIPVFTKSQTGNDKKNTQKDQRSFMQISGVYPHLAVFNNGAPNPCGSGNGGECGIGAVVPWAGKLWMITYSPHCPNGSSDKLYSIDHNLELSIQPESVGSTPASRMIHKESNQLIIGSYFIDENCKVRVIPLTVMPGRMTATARHLFDPANMVYFYDMEGMLYEVNVHTLAVKKLFHKPVPGWHGKGGYTAQNRLIIANNGEHQVFDVDPKDLQVGGAPKNKDEKGVLASWDGKRWSIIERKQFTDVTGPGGIYGSPTDESPAWSIGWDDRSVLLKLLDNGKWYTYRLPKSTHTYDHWGGWYTEWPRIREIGYGKMLMDMHGMFYNFPKTFSYKNNAGIAPISNHLRYIPDFCNWNGKLVLATDETTILENPMAGRSQSNIWIGEPTELKNWGAVNGWGGPWMNDEVKAGETSDPFLINGFANKILHLNHNLNEPNQFTIEMDQLGNNQWKVYKQITVAASAYAYFIFPANFKANWVRIKSAKAAKVSAFFHFSAVAHAKQDAVLFTSIADINEKGDFQQNFIRPAGHNTNLQVLNSNGTVYNEVNEKMQFIQPGYDSSNQMKKLLAFKNDIETDDASIIVKDKTGTFRLPKASALYDHLTYRQAREIESERYMLNAGGTFFEVGRESGFAAIRPITSHKKKIVDFCTWRGLLVISGTKSTAVEDGHYFSNNEHTNGLWFGAVDDLWKLDKPTGEGGLWKNESVTAGRSSLPFLMTGYDKKTITLTADKDVTITLEVNYDLNGWHEYKKFRVAAGKTITHKFPAGYSAHWIRAIADKDCNATVWMKYE